MSNAPKAPTENADLNRNEGEGSKSAGRHYDDAASKFAKSGKVDDAAEQAREYVTTHAEDAAAAEKAGKAPLTVHIPKEK